MRILVTGGAGFIGSHVAGCLIRDGHEVEVIDDFNDYYDPRIKRTNLVSLGGAARLHEGDIRDRDFVQKTISLGRFDAIVHLAARAGVRQAVEIPEAYLQTNAAGTLNILEWCRKGGPSKLVLASTSSIYGANPPLPTPEDADSCHPLQIYAASKKAAEVMAYTYHHLYGLDATVVRFFTVYGPAGRPDMVMFRFTRWIAEGDPVQITGDGNQMRGFTYLDDIADGVLKALKPVGYEIINLGGHETITINDLLHRIENLVGKKADIQYIPRHPADVDANWADVSKARRMLGWEPKVTLDEGLSHLVNWYLEQRSWARDIILS